MKALKNAFEKKDVYSENVSEANIILFNSMHCFDDIIKLKRKSNNAIFVHRVDGPCKLYNKMTDRRDEQVYMLNEKVADATIFQSEYSREASLKMGCPRHKFEVTITNASNPAIFYPGNEKENRDKIRLIATSFSDNWNKGFSTYKWMDENLDFEKYEMYFVGRSPVDFKNIKKFEPMRSESLARILRNSDIYITASKNDPCSNSLIEALSCGIPALALNSGGHPELVKDGGEIYNDNYEIPILLDKIAQNYDLYQNRIKAASMEDVCNQYLSFFELLLEKREQGELDSNKFLLGDYISVFLKDKLGKYSKHFTLRNLKSEK